MSSYAAKHRVSCTVVLLVGEAKLLSFSVMLLGVDDDGIQLVRSEDRLGDGQ